MKYNFICLAFLVFIGCESILKKNGHAADKVKLKTNNKALIENFTQAHQLADSIVRKVVDKKELNDFTTKYGFNYENWEKNLNDTLTHLPISYKFYYGLKLDRDTIGSGIIEIDTSLKIVYAGVERLLGYKGFLNRKLMIGPKQAASIARKYGINSDSASFLFDATMSLKGVQPIIQFDPFTEEVNSYEKKLCYYWQVESKCDGCPFLQINAINGGIITEGKMEHYY